MTKEKEDFRASEGLLQKLHNALAEDLLKRLKSGEATAPEIAAAIKFLKDNGIEAVRDQNPTVDKLADALPEFNDKTDLTGFEGGTVN